MGNCIMEITKASSGGALAGVSASAGLLRRRERGLDPGVFRGGLFGLFLKLFLERLPGRHLRRLKSFWTSSWAPVGPPQPSSWAILWRLGGTWPPIWLPKSTKILQKSMPRCISFGSALLDKFFIDFWSQLVHQKTN
jgi:hypothetical protein